MIAPLRHFILTGALLATLTACKEQQQQMPPPPEVGVLEAKQQTVPLEREMVGRLSAFRSADVRARVPGVLLRRVYQEGTDVKEGQVLFLIDPAPLQAALNVAQSQLAQAEASYANAKMIADRARQLAPQKYISQNDLDNAIATERTTAAAVQGARADVANAKINLEYASVHAPISGRAGQQQVTEGALVGQGNVTLLTTIDQLDPLYVNFSMSANEMAELRRAQGSGNVELANVGKATVQIMLGDGSIYDQTGTVDFYDFTVDPATGSVSLRALLPKPNPTLLPGS
ncbi:MAG: efflux RND transporter periplasmic adaptor subunit, partial [Xanthomonadaceae bacterium]|nr:efflux RND transporter periplasmic adaptor subunit [Xanthomonadaceae bacterium]